MALSVVILVPSGKGENALRPLLGAPVAIRALAAVLPPRQSVTAVLVSPTEHHAALHAAAEKFGFTELRHFIPPGASEIGSIRAALGALKPAGDDVILVHHALYPLCPVALTTRVIEAGTKDGAAVATLAVPGAMFGSGETLGAPVADALVQAQWPAVFTRGALEAVTAAPLEGDLLQAASRREGGVRSVAGDRDLFAVEEEADLTRALEAWGRRATEYAFIWPRPSDENTQSHARAELNMTIPDTPPSTES